MNFILDIYNGRLIADVNAPQTVPDVTMICRDIVAVTVTVVKLNPAVGDGGNLYIPMNLPNAGALCFGAKPTTALDGDNFVSAADWTPGSEGVYTGFLSLTEQPLIDAVGVNAEVNLLAEFTTLNGANKSNSVQFNLKIKPAVMRGNEPVNVLVSPSGLTRWALTIDDEGQVTTRRIS